MNRKHISTKYNKAFTEFMKPSEEKTSGEENTFRMPPQPLLTLDGIKIKPTDTKHLEMEPMGSKTEDKHNDS